MALSDLRTQYSTDDSFVPPPPGDPELPDEGCVRSPFSRGMKMKSKKTRVLHMAPEEAYRDRFAGPKLTAEQMVAQSRRCARHVARDIGLTRWETHVALVEFPIRGEEEAFVNRFLAESGERGDEG